MTSTKGTVKWFNPTKGYGFIEQENGQDIFVHITAVQEAQMTTLMEGQKVSFEVTTNRGKDAATNLQVVED